MTLLLNQANILQSNSVNEDENIDANEDDDLNEHYNPQLLSFHY